MKKRKLKYVFFVLFFIGVLAANILGKESLQQMGIFNTYYLQQLQYAGIDETELLLYLLKERLTILFLLGIFGITEFWYPVHLVYVAWNGGALGFLFVSAISGLGMKGILLVLLSLFPQYIFYVALYLVLLEVHTLLHNGMRNGSGGRGKGGRYLLGAGLIFVLFVFGILTETYINPHIMKNILRIF